MSEGVTGTHNPAETLRGNVEAGLRLLLKSDKPLYRRTAEVGMEDLDRLVAALEESEANLRNALDAFSEVASKADAFEERVARLEAERDEHLKEIVRLSWSVAGDPPYPGDHEFKFREAGPRFCA